MKSTKSAKKKLQNIRSATHSEQTASQ